MSHGKQLSHELGREEDVQTDLLILGFLREEILIGNLEHVSIRESYRQGVFSAHTDSSWEFFRRRALHQIGLGFAEPLIQDSEQARRGRRADERKDVGYLCPLRITPQGFVRIGQLERELKKYQGWVRHVTRAKELYQKMVGMKGGIAIGLTIFLIVPILAFGIKVSKVVQSIPILSSIIDTKMLSEFETINENDIFYNAAISELGLAASLGRGHEETILAQQSTTQPALSDGARKPKIESVAVRNISPDEKLFRITVEDGNVWYLRVQKENSDYLTGSK